MLKTIVIIKKIYLESLEKNIRFSRDDRLLVKGIVLLVM
jgi:hypothetical protein